MNNFSKKSKKIYLDYASSSLIREANPGSIHALGLEEKNKLRDARQTVARILQVQNEEIIFTSGATESNNLAILGVVNAQNLTPSPSPGEERVAKSRVRWIPHIVTTNIEHASVLEVCKYLEKTKRAEVTYVPVERNGIVDPGKIKKALKSNTVLVSVIYANNEIGTIQPIRDIAKEIRHFNKINSKDILLHTDAVQAVNYLPVGVPQLGVQLMSMNGAKIYGPKGIGTLFVKKGTPIEPIMFGGSQEFGLRPGTENVALANGFAKALNLAEKTKDSESKRLIKLRDYFIKKLLAMPFDIQLNGGKENRLPNNINVSVPKIPSELLVIELSARGIMASAKSACKSGDSEASYVVRAVNPEVRDEDGSLRFSLGRLTTKKDIDAVLKALALVLKKIKKWYN